MVALVTNWVGGKVPKHYNGPNHGGYRTTASVRNPSRWPSLYKTDSVNSTRLRSDRCSVLYRRQLKHRQVIVEVSEACRYGAGLTRAQHHMGLTFPINSTHTSIQRSDFWKQHLINQQSSTTASVLIVPP
ncbi:uncharacterized protein CYBJADRAFT_169737 [Cyberlindnera jadinii NRRL Y-1542]|uniref:Uncharacterized protein n=1 Tax=Cyberlindnera jadinii (strain ATCC 18201 / CBS 1600 / BCRC 20928 / JCM 3617 / NBRC 0987 / NRRL Y-1542) TaxID=983966 RepID=A0A1E4RUN6_CYBJN|nr:hypothetical protein CYBJADRAFT_169737 [Cyberlindnera jadinii NRRL Y-1542]ODV70982.1 hypothetical protein CYBJADRAFT_169737 [Cyberlindnera jadinii NRRL Y-1542]